MLEVREVSKIYTKNAGVKDISFSVGEGKILALIGPNGSGKSTLLNIISGVLKPDTGRIFLNNMDVKDIQTRKYIGYLPDNIVVNPQIKVIDLLYMVSDYKYHGEYKNEIDKRISDYRLEKCCNERFYKLSMGTKKKIGILIAFMGMPKLIILDEPTNGMDTYGILQLKESILEAKKSGSIVLISSHILDFVNSIAECSLFLRDMSLAACAKKEDNLEEIYKDLYL